MAAGVLLKKKKRNRELCLNYNHEFIELLELYAEEEQCSQ